MIFHREFVEEPAPHVATDNADDGEHAGDLKILAKTGLDAPLLNDDELPHQT